MVKSRIIQALLILLVLSSLFSLSAGAFVGTGVEVLSREVRVIKSALLGKRISFSDADFKCAFAIDGFDAITVTSLPSSNEGTLLLAGRRVREGQTVARRNIAALVFVPKDASVRRASFSFTLDGGEEHECEMKFLEKINRAPTIDRAREEKASITTQENISIFGRMSATDPEGDALEFIIAAYPKTGRLAKTSEGSYKYTPAEGFTGYDRFVYVARDEYGNYSRPMEVILKVTERTSETVYVDMTDRAEYNAAVAMSAMGIMSGRLVGDDQYFMPDEAVTRAEFVAMALKSKGIKADTEESFFDDTSEIPASLERYVAKAARLGIVSGEYENGRLLFSPNKPISIYEAASIMSGIIGVSDNGSGEYSSADNVPVWARGDVTAMVTLGIIDSDTADLTSTVTRGIAAEYLYRMVNNS